MANQTSRTSQKQSTPHSIGRLMDADFSGIIIGDLLLTGHKAQKTYFLPLCCSSAPRRTVECLRR